MIFNLVFLSVKTIPCQQYTLTKGSKQTFKYILGYAPLCSLIMDWAADVEGNMKIARQVGDLVEFCYVIW